MQNDSGIQQKAARRVMMLREILQQMINNLWIPMRAQTPAGLPVYSIY